MVCGKKGFVLRACCQTSEVQSSKKSREELLSFLFPSCTHVWLQIASCRVAHGVCPGIQNELSRRAVPTRISGWRGKGLIENIQLDWLAHPCIVSGESWIDVTVQYARMAASWLLRAIHLSSVLILVHGKSLNVRPLRNCNN